MHADEEDRHLERQLAQRPAAAGARVPRAAQARPAADAGDQGRPGQVPRPRARRGGLPRRPPLGGPLGGRRDRRADARPSSPTCAPGLDGRARRRRGALAGGHRRLAARRHDLRPERARRRLAVLRGQAALPRRRRRADPRPLRRRAAGRGGLQRLPGRPRRLRPGGVRGRDARHAGRARALPGAAGRGHRRLVPLAAPGRARLHLVGLPRRATSTRRWGCGSTRSWSRRRSLRG